VAGCRQISQPWTNGSSSSRRAAAEEFLEDSSSVFCRPGAIPPTSGTTPAPLRILAENHRQIGVASTPPTDCAHHQWLVLKRSLPMERLGPYPKRYLRAPPLPVATPQRDIGPRLMFRSQTNVLTPNSSVRDRRNRPVPCDREGSTENSYHACSPVLGE